MVKRLIIPAMPLLGIYPEEPQAGCTPCPQRPHSYQLRDGNELRVQQAHTDKLWSIHTAGWYPASERKEILTSATTWLDPEDTTLSAKSQSGDPGMMAGTWSSQAPKWDGGGGEPWPGEGLGVRAHGVRASTWEDRQLWGHSVNTLSDTDLSKRS